MAKGFQWREKGKIGELYNKKGDRFGFKIYHTKGHYDYGVLKCCIVKVQRYGIQINPIDMEDKCVGQFVLPLKYWKELNQALWRELET